MDWKYIAGFFDGEGSLIKHYRRGYRVVVSQTHLGVLESMQDFAGAGIVFEVTKRKKHWKDAWVWAIAAQGDVLYFLNHISPYCIVKKELVDEAIPEIRLHIKDMKTRSALTTQRRHDARQLRSKRLTYRAIGKKLDIDHGYARRLILGWD